MTGMPRQRQILIALAFAPRSWSTNALSPGRRRPGIEWSFCSWDGVKQNARLTIRRWRPLARIEPCGGLGQGEPSGTNVGECGVDINQHYSVLPGMRHGGK